MRTWVFLFLVPWPVAGSSQNWSAPPIALSQVGIREKQNHPFSLLPFLVPGVWGTFPVVLESRGSVSHWQFQSWLHFISTSCNAIKTSWEVFLGVSKQSFPDTVLLLAVPGQQRRTGRCSRTLAAVLCPMHGTSPFILATAARSERGSRGKATADPTEPRAEASDLPHWHLSLSILKLPGKLEVAEDFPFPFSLWYMSFTPDSTDKAATEIVGCWLLSRERHFQNCDMAHALALPPLAFQRAAAQLKIHMYSTHFPAKNWASGKCLAEAWFSAKRAQTLPCLG